MGRNGRKDRQQDEESEVEFGPVGGAQEGENCPLNGERNRECVGDFHLNDMGGAHDDRGMGGGAAGGSGLNSEVQYLGPDGSQSATSCVMQQLAGLFIEIVKQNPEVLKEVVAVLQRINNGVGSNGVGDCNQRYEGRRMEMESRSRRTQFENQEAHDRADVRGPRDPTGESYFRQRGPYRVTGLSPGRRSPFRDYQRRFQEGYRNTSRTVKMPPFSGNEDWNVWFNRFDIIARRQGWTREERLDNLLPRLDGEAAEFVFAQLPPNIVEDYGALIGELDSQYLRIETTRTFAAQFSQRNQKNGESVEAYAAELKRLYTKAHGYRDARTRQEDLVRRFLDGLWDPDVRQQVEFTKEPLTIDEAVYHVVCCFQTKDRAWDKRGDGQRKPVRGIMSSDEEDIEDRETIGRVPERRGNRDRPATRGQVDSSNTVEPPAKQKEPSSLGENPEIAAIVKAVVDGMSKILEPIRKHHEQRPRTKIEDITCFKCGEKGHYANKCWDRLRGPSNATGETLIRRVRSLGSVETGISKELTALQELKPPDNGEQGPETRWLWDRRRCYGCKERDHMVKEDPVSVGQGSLITV